MFAGREFRRQIKQSAGLVGLGALVVALSGCGEQAEDLSGRPFIMSCTGENLMSTGENEIDSDNLPTRLAGVALPDHREMVKTPSFRGALFRESGFTAQKGALKGNVATLPLAHLRYEMEFRDTGRRLVSDSGFFKSRETASPSGEARIHHYYLTSGGDLQKVENFHIARGARGHHRHGRYYAVERTVAARLPSDATYAVYFIEAEQEAEKKVGEVIQEPVATRKGRSGYWVQPLTEKHRYQPVDYSFADPYERGLGPYVGSKRHLKYENDPVVRGPNNGGMPVTANRRANEDVETAQLWSCNKVGNKNSP